MLVSALCVQMHYHRCFSVSELTLAAVSFDTASGQGLTLPAGFIVTQQRHRAKLMTLPLSVSL
jgi:hypothetical protein